MGVAPENRQNPVNKSPGRDDTFIDTDKLPSKTGKSSQIEISWWLPDNTSDKHFVICLGKCLP